MRRTGLCGAIGVAGLELLAPGGVWAGGIPASVLEEVTVTGKLARLQGVALSASQGIVMDEQLSLRPVLRTGELLETVPGLIVTQHSGSGKANQFFLRGFNLDHGTDLATSVDGVPVNMPTHGHGQGYTDINFVIPELVESIEYRKGTYYAETGNFSAAGAINMRYRRKLDAPMLLLEGGEDSYARGLFATSADLGAGDLLLALDYANIDGPWLLEENYRRANAILRHTLDAHLYKFGITAQGYDGRWRSTDQIPLRAMRSGQIDRFGFVDPTNGGESHRYTLSADLSGPLLGGELRALAYTVDYRLDLISNFSYFTTGDSGDQFEQLDDRRIYGGEASWTAPFKLAGLDQKFAAGIQMRYDDIDKVALYSTTARVRTGTVREDAVQQASYSTYISLSTEWNDKVHTTFGLRGDHFDFEVDSDLAINSGAVSDSIASPKFVLVLGPWRETEFFFDVGAGFHSNDGRGTTIRVDPPTVNRDAADPFADAAPADRVDPLVKALGADIGMRTAIVPNAQLSLSLWGLELDSELVFVGDAGVTEASRKSERRGIEVSALWNPISWLLIDADFARSRARFAGADPDNAGDHIPGAVELVASLGAAIDHPSGWSGAVRLRHFGDAPLLEDNTARSEPTTIVNVEAGYKFGQRYKISAAVFNVLDSNDNDITYFYESQLRGEAVPVQDIHLHPVEPRTLRLTLLCTF